MTLVRAITYSEARNNLSHVLDSVVNDVEPAIITRRGDKEGDCAVIVMSLKSYNSMVETTHVLRGGNRRHLQKSIAELKAGKARQKVLVEDDKA